MISPSGSEALLASYRRSLSKSDAESGADYAGKAMSGYVRKTG